MWHQVEGNIIIPKLKVGNVKRKKKYIYIYIWTIWTFIYFILYTNIYVLSSPKIGQDESSDMNKHLHGL